MGHGFGCKRYVGRQRLFESLSEALLSAEVEFLPLPELGGRSSHWAGVGASSDNALGSFRAVAEVESRSVIVNSGEALPELPMRTTM